MQFGLLNFIIFGLDWKIIQQFLLGFFLLHADGMKSVIPFIQMRHQTSCHAMAWKNHLWRAHIAGN